MSQSRSSSADSPPQDKTTSWVRRHRKLVIGVIAGISLAAAVYILSESQSQKVIRLGTLGGNSSLARAINNTGQIVGTSTTKDGQSHAFLWTKEYGMQDLNNCSENSSDATSINNAGQVIIVAKEGNESYAPRSNDSCVKYTTYLWTKEHGMQKLSALGENVINACAINNIGQVSGTVDRIHAFLWTKECGMQNLGSLGGTFSGASAINDVGQIIGLSETKNRRDYHAFLWTKEHGMQDLNTLGGPTSVAQSINSTGQVIGVSITENEKKHAFLWTKECGMQDLGALGKNGSTADAINNAGEVVGYSETKNGETHAFFWTKECGMQDLNPPGAVSSAATLINDTGHIVGIARYSPPWWVNAWDWLGQKLNLPISFLPRLKDHEYSEAVLWIIPPTANTSD